MGDSVAGILEKGKTRKNTGFDAQIEGGTRCPSYKA